MTRRSLLLSILAGSAIIVALVVLVLRPGPQGQAEALFERIAAHLEQGAAGDIVAEVEEGYDFAAHFPILDRVEEMALAEDAGAGVDRDAVMRESLRRTINRWFGPQQLQKEQVVTWRLHEVGAPTADGSFSAHVSFSVTGLSPVPTLTNHRFVLATHGWFWPVARIRDHDPISL